MGRLVYLPTYIYHKNQAFNVGKYTVQSSHGSVMGLKENDQLPSTDMVRRRGWAERPVMGNCDRPSSWGNPAVKMCVGQQIRAKNVVSKIFVVVSQLASWDGR